MMLIAKARLEYGRLFLKDGDQILITLESGINVGVCLIIFGLFSSGYVFIKGSIFINFFIFLIFFFSFFPLALYVY